MIFFNIDILKKVCTKKIVYAPLLLHLQRVKNCVNNIEYRYVDDVGFGQVKPRYFFPTIPLQDLFENITTSKL